MFVPAIRLQAPTAQQACLTPAVGSEWVHVEDLVCRLESSEAVTRLPGVCTEGPLRRDDHPSTNHYKWVALVQGCGRDRTCEVNAVPMGRDLCVG